LTKEALARRAGYRCSNPGCRKLTSGPRSDPVKAVSRRGDARQAGPGMGGSEGAAGSKPALQDGGAESEEAPLREGQVPSNRIESNPIRARRALLFQPGALAPGGRRQPQLLTSVQIRRILSAVLHNPAPYANTRSRPHEAQGVHSAADDDRGQGGTSSENAPYKHRTNPHEHHPRPPRPARGFPSHRRADRAARPDRFPRKSSNRTMNPMRDQPPTRANLLNLSGLASRRPCQT
jgi:hypothetical protein